MARALLTIALALCLVSPAWAADLRPIERLGKRPPLAASEGSPAARARADFERQDLRGQIRRLEGEAGRRGETSAIKRAQRAFPPSPAPTAQRLGEARRDLNRLRHLGQP